MLENGKYGIIKSVTFQQLEIPETTYNFEVEDYHTYYVGEKGILVHNMDCGVIDQSIPDGYEPTFKNGKYIANDGKHGSIKKGNISRNVPNLYGQYALDNSISFGGKARFAYNGKEVIQLYPGSGNMSNIYHGFYTDWRLINDSTFRNYVEHYFRL